MLDQIVQVGNVCPTKTRSNPNQGRVYDPSGISPTLSCMGGGNLEPHIIIYNDYNRRGVSDVSISKTGEKFRVRKLTPKECWRLMGFEDKDFENARNRMNENLYNGNDRSSSQLYKQAGNSIVVDVLSAIMGELYEVVYMSIALRDRREAYEKIKPKRPNRKAMILEVLTAGDPGGMTADEIGDQLVAEGKIPANSPNFTRPRLTEMKAEGKVIIVGRRPGKSGCNTAVWKVAR